MRRVSSEGDGWAFHPHHLVRDAVCLMLKRVVDLSDSWLRLYERGGRLRPAWRVGLKHWDLAQALYGLIPDRAL